MAVVEFGAVLPREQGGGIDDTRSHVSHSGSFLSATPTWPSKHGLISHRLPNLDNELRNLRTGFCRTTKSLMNKGLNFFRFMPRVQFAGDLVEVVARAAQLYVDGSKFFNIDIDDGATIRPKTTPANKLRCGHTRQCGAVLDVLEFISIEPDVQACGARPHGAGL